MNLLGNGECDDACNNADCKFDFDDCKSALSKGVESLELWHILLIVGGLFCCVCSCVAAGVGVFVRKMKRNQQHARGNDSAHIEMNPLY